MKGEKGVCLAGEIPNQIRRTKFNTEVNATIACNSHKGFGFISQDYVVYKCKVCGFWHFGKPAWRDKFGLGIKN